MAFEHKQYPDGDTSFRLPKWKKIIESIESENQPMVYGQENEQDDSFQSNEVGLKHPKNGSFIRIKDDGTIEAFTAYGTGFRVKENNSFQLFSDQIQLIGRELDVRSQANGTNLNGEVLGADAYQSFPYKKGLNKTFLSLAKEQGIETHGLEETK